MHSTSYKGHIAGGHPLNELLVSAGYSPERDTVNTPNSDQVRFKH